MTLRTIVSVPDPVLRKKARKVSSINREVRVLLEDMLETLRAAPGVGLAAPQIGISERVIVVEYAEDPEEEDAPPPTPKVYQLVNPELVRRSRAMVFGHEGCLSVPGFSGDVERHESVTVEGLNPHGDTVRIRAKGWLARIFQHEIDHLDGVLFTDRAAKVWAITNPDEDETHDNV
jgi:peptide deformylase